MTEFETRRDGELPAVPVRRARRGSLLPLFAAGVTGAAWSAAVQIVATPFYLRFLGIESYGLIGFYLTLQAVLAVFDLGISVTVSREIARLAAAGTAVELRRLIRTFELLYWTLAAALAAAIALGSGVIVREWFGRTTIAPDQLRRTIVLMAFLWAFQWLVSFYQAALIGFEKLVAMNLIRIVATTALHLGAVVFLWRVSRSAAALFGYQSVVSIVHCAVIATFLWMIVPAAPVRALPGIDVLQSRWRFALGMAGITICGTLLAQTDKLVVSHLVPLRNFGFYSLAAVIATALYVAVIPVFNTILPRLSGLVARHDREGVVAIYRGACQAVAVLCAVPAGLIAFFGHDIILIWTRMPDVSREAAPIAACLILGSALNGMMTPPYALQLANGASSLGLSISSAQLVVYVPAVIVLASRYGVLGAAAAWVFINAAYVLVGIPITHRRFLGTAGFDWIRDVGPPLVAAFAVTGGASLFHLRMQRLPQLLWITAVGVLATLAALAFAPSIRSAIAAFLRKTETQ